MDYRLGTILAPVDIGASGTQVCNIDIQDPITRISIAWKYTVVTVSAMTARAIDCLSKIELIDGAEVLWSASGSQIFAANAYNRKRLPASNTSLTVGGFCERIIELDFGRWFCDETLALRPELFNNLQLRITYDEDAANASVVVNELAVYAHIMENLNKQPMGMLCLKQYKDYSMTASSHEYTDLPVDSKIKAIYLQSESTDHDPVTLLSNIKLNVDNGKRVPLDVGAALFWRMLKSKYPKFEYNVTLDDAVTAKTIYADVSKDVDVQINYDDTDFVTAQSNFAEATVTGHKVALAASVDIKALTANISGNLPGNVIPWLTGDEWSIDQWFSPGNAKSLQLDLTASSDADSGDNTRVVLEQLKVY